MNKFEETYLKIISEMSGNHCLIDYYAAFSEDGTLIGKDENLRDLEMNCTTVDNHVDKFKIYHVDDLSRPKKYKLIETYTFNKETNNWDVLSN